MRRPPINTDLDLSVVIPTFNREGVLLDSIEYLTRQSQRPREILVIDQTREHSSATVSRLEQLRRDGIIKWIRLSSPSIPKAMNTGLLAAQSATVLFVDDDIVPDRELLETHFNAHRARDAAAVVGRIIQPWHVSQSNLAAAAEGDPDRFQFNSTSPGWIRRVMAGNLSVRRDEAIRIGGFDENFKGAAFRFEAEFAERLVQRKCRIWYEPNACLRHLKAERGGIRTFGLHYSTFLPHHSVGAYYYLISVRTVRNRVGKITLRLLKSPFTRHHLRYPWQIPLTTIAEVSGLLWAMWLVWTGPKLLHPVSATGSK